MKTTFKLYEQREKQQAELSKQQTERQRHIEEAQAELAAAHNEHSALVKRYVTDLSLDKDLDAADERVTAAKKKLERLQASVIEAPDQISKDELVEAWKTEFVPAFQKNEHQPSLDRLKKAKEAYLKELESHRTLVNEYDDFVKEVAASCGRGYDNKFGRPPFDRRPYTFNGSEVGEYEKL